MPEVKCAHDELVELTRLVPNPRNPNRHPRRQIELLAKIIEVQGWRAPITVSTRSGFIVRAHNRPGGGRHSRRGGLVTPEDGPAGVLEHPGRS